MHLPPIPRPDAEQTEQTLLECYERLAESLSLPFRAYYPEPTNSEEESEFRCTVLELLDPSKHLGDEFDGIFCKIRKGKFEVNLPLLELHVPSNNRNFPMIAEYWRWFGNWQTVSYRRS